MNDGEAKMEAALRPFGWTCGPDFWQRYYSDPWVFNLANAVESLTESLGGVPAAAPAGRTGSFRPGSVPDGIPPGPVKWDDEVPADKRGADVNELDFDAIRARCAAATPGPWEAGPPEYGRWTVAGLHNPNAVEARNIYATTNWLKSVAADADFIAHAREDVPGLLDHIERCETALRWIAERCQEAIDADEDALLQWQAALAFTVACVNTTLERVPAAAPDHEAEAIVAFPDRQLYEGRFPEKEQT